MDVKEDRDREYRPQALLPNTDHRKPNTAALAAELAAEQGGRLGRVSERAPADLDAARDVV